MHCAMRNPEDPGLTQLTMEMTRIKMGHGSTLTQQVQAALAEAEAAAEAEGAALPVRRGVRGGGCRGGVQ